MVRMKVLRDHGTYRKGMVVLMGWVEAIKASVQGWATTERGYERAVRAEQREVR